MVIDYLRERQARLPASRVKFEIVLLLGVGELGGSRPLATERGSGFLDVDHGYSNE